MKPPNDKENKARVVDSNGIGKMQIEKEIYTQNTVAETPKLRTFISVIKVLCVIGLLFAFICSLDLLSTAFTLISGKSTGGLYNNDYISNPIVGLMIGILLTVLVQSSSTATSIIVSVVAAGLVEPEDAIPMIMGSNIGTSVTNTIVSLTQVGNVVQFERAFSGATVHDMFNWMSVIVILPLEILTGMLDKLTQAITNSISDSANGAELKMLTVLTEPVTEHIIQIDDTIMMCWSIGELQDEESMILEYCKYELKYNCSDTTCGSTLNPITTTYTSSSPIPEDCKVNNTITGVKDSCSFLFYNTGMSDTVVGVILLIISLFVLCASLILIVKLLNSMLKGTVAKIIKRVLNANIPYVPWLTGYLAIVIGAFLTFLVQSSSIFTSTLTPLIGLGIISVDRAYPLCLGSNLGTTTTALLASLASQGTNQLAAMQIALVHLFFNLFGIMIFYPIPFMRLPLPACKALGRVTASYRWFAVLYLIVMFFLLPASIFALTFGGPAVFWGVIGPVLIFLLLVVVINVLQRKRPTLLPKVLRSWEFLPLPLHSLQPYDAAILKLPCCTKCRNADETIDEESEEIEENAITEVTENTRDETEGRTDLGMIGDWSTSQEMIYQTSKDSVVMVGEDNVTFDMASVTKMEVIISKM